MLFLEQLCSQGQSNTPACTEHEVCLRMVVPPVIVLTVFPPSKEFASAAAQRSATWEILSSDEDEPALCT